MEREHVAFKEPFMEWQLAYWIFLLYVEIHTTMQHKDLSSKNL
jgi:hypothetical protein